MRGFNEEGTTTTPFDMVVLNEMSRFHLCMEVLRRCRRSIPNADTLIRRCDAQLARHHDYVREHLDDMPEIRDWTWTRESGDEILVAVSPLAGKPADPSLLVNVPRLVTAYYTGRPDPAVPAQRVSFGTSGHRGSSFDDAFNEAHILAITQAICRYRARRARSTDRSSSASTPTRSRSRRSPARSRCWRPTAST